MEGAWRGPVLVFCRSDRLALAIELAGAEWLCCRIRLAGVCVCYLQWSKVQAPSQTSQPAALQRKTDNTTLSVLLRLVDAGVSTRWRTASRLAIHLMAACRRPIFMMTTATPRRTASWKKTCWLQVCAWVLPLGGRAMSHAPKCKSFIAVI